MASRIGTYGGVNSLFLTRDDRIEIERANLIRDFGEAVVTDAQKDIMNSQGEHVPFNETFGELKLLKLACQLRIPPAEGMQVPDTIKGLSELQNKKLEYIRKVAALNPQSFCNPHYRQSSAAEHATMDVASILDDASEGVLVHLPTRDAAENATTPYRVRKAIQREGWGAFILCREIPPPSDDPELIVLGRPTAQAEIESIMHNLAETSGQAKVEEHAEEFVGALRNYLEEMRVEKISFQGYSQGGAIASQYLIKMLGLGDLMHLREVDLTLWHAPGLSNALADQLIILAAAQERITFACQINQVEHDQVHDAGDRQPFMKSRFRNLKVEYLRWSLPEIAADRLRNPGRYLELHTTRCTDDWNVRPVISQSFDLRKIHGLLDYRYTLRDEEETGTWMDQMNRAAFNARCAEMVELETTVKTRFGRRGTVDQAAMGVLLQCAKNTLHQTFAPKQSLWTRAWGVTKLAATGTVAVVAAPWAVSGVAFVAAQGPITAGFALGGGLAVVGAAAPTPEDPVGLSYDAPLA